MAGILFTRSAGISFELKFSISIHPFEEKYTEKIEQNYLVEHKRDQ